MSKVYVNKTWQTHEMLDLSCFFLLLKLCHFGVIKKDLKFTEYPFKHQFQNIPQLLDMTVFKFQTMPVSTGPLSL